MSGFSARAKKALESARLSGDSNKEVLLAIGRLCALAHELRDEADLIEMQIAVLCGKVKSETPQQGKKPVRRGTAQRKPLAGEKLDPGTSPEDAALAAFKVGRGRPN